MVEAAQLLGRSIRQVRRLRRAFRTRGTAALVHGKPVQEPALGARKLTLFPERFQGIA